MNFLYDEKRRTLTIVLLEPACYYDVTDFWPTYYDVIDIPFVAKRRDRAA